MKSIYPICFAQLISYSKKLVFQIQSKKIIINSYINEILFLIEICDGKRSLTETALLLSENSNIDINVSLDLINELLDLNILIDSREQMKYYHELTINPNDFYRRSTNDTIEELLLEKTDIPVIPLLTLSDKITKDLNLFRNIVSKRSSCRSFKNSPVELEKIFNICKIAYNLIEKPVASGGGLYPLSIFFINRHNNKNFPKGVYKYDSYNNAILLYKDTLEDDELLYALNDSSFIFGASCIFFIVADILKHMKKYSNRGYRYTILEVGHVLQNITLGAIEDGLSSVEYGGFRDYDVKKMLGIKEDSMFPIGCIAIGEASKVYTNTEKIPDKLEYLERMIVSKYGIIEKRFNIKNTLLETSFINAVISKFKQPSPGSPNYVDRYGTGIGNTVVEANIKSLMEAYERFVCGCYYCDIECNANELDNNYINPSTYAPYSDDQFASLNLMKFDETKLWQWVKGINYNGKSVWIPVDLCFYPISKDNVNRELCHFANSSGCAAHFDLESAKQNSLLELIERDCIMKTWLENRIPDRILKETLPNYIQKRIDKYVNMGFEIDFLILENKYSFTILACVYNANNAPFFICGAASSFESLEKSIRKAFDEMELSLTISLESISNNNFNTDITPENVKTPLDHGDLYIYNNHLDKINFLFSGKYISFEEAKNLCNNFNFNNIIDSLKPVFLEYNHDLDNVHVIRAFVSSLVPINFGYRSDFFNHSSLEINKTHYKGFPHYFA